MNTKRLLKFLYAAIGIGVLAFVVSVTDLGEVWALLKQIGWGFGIVLLAYLLSFIGDTLSWHAAFPGFAFTPRNHYRVWKVRMIGEVFNNITPFLGGMGGEPVKALLMKNSYGVGLREATASLVAAKTITLIALVIFLAIGLTMMASGSGISSQYISVAAIGMAAFSLGILLFYLVQRFRVTSVLGARLGRSSIGQRIENLLHAVRDVDDLLVAFYTGRRGRFAASILAALIGWVFGALEIYAATHLLGGEITLTEAWIVEAVAQLMRAGTFFIPASLGIQEGTFLLLYDVLTGRPAMGVAVALLRRARELIWIGWGGLLLARMRSAQSSKPGGGT